MVRFLQTYAGGPRTTGVCVRGPLCAGCARCTPDTVSVCGGESMHAGASCVCFVSGTHALGARVSVGAGTNVSFGGVRSYRWIFNCSCFSRSYF